MDGPLANKIRRKAFNETVIRRLTQTGLCASSRLLVQAFRFENRPFRKNRRKRRCHPSAKKLPSDHRRRKQSREG